MKSLDEFHDKFHKLGKDRFAVNITPDDMDRREKLITEEYKEVLYEIEYVKHQLMYPKEYTTEDKTNAKRQLAKELADLLYVLYGTADELCIPLEDVFNRIHEANMSKVWPDGKVRYNEYGKIIKPDTFTPANVDDLIGSSV
jgi:predicted HAD superfamily Cof-like phosphohydrolase